MKNRLRFRAYKSGDPLMVGVDWAFEGEDSVFFIEFVFIKWCLLITWEEK